MRVRPDPENDFDRKFMQKIDDHGWAVMCVAPRVGGEAGPIFQYSAGIFDRCGRPELLVTGLGTEVGRWVINEYGHRAEAGEEFVPFRRYGGFLDGHSVTFLSVDSKIASGEYTIWTDWYYGRQSFPLMQLVWPDSKTGALPWEEGYRHELRDVQPLLADGRQLN